MKCFTACIVQMFPDGGSGYIQCSFSLFPSSLDVSLGLAMSFELEAHQDFYSVQLNVDNRPLLLYAMTGPEVKILVGVSGCPVESSLMLPSFFTWMWVSADPGKPRLPHFHLYGKLYVRVDIVQVFNEAYSVVTVQLGVQM